MEHIANADFRETRVRVGQEVVGIPNGPLPPPQAPCVLMVYGRASQKDEVGGLYQRLAVSLANRGIASLRIDLRGSSAAH